MTYFNARPDTFAPEASATAPSAPYIGLRRLGERRVLAMLWYWVCRLFRASEQSPRGRQNAAVRLAGFMIVFTLCLMPGSVQERGAILESMMHARRKQREARYKALDRAYLIWRQRKCWMWGGGFMACALGYFRAGGYASLDARSYDALIPD